MEQDLAEEKARFVEIRWNEALLRKTEADAKPSPTEESSHDGANAAD